MKLTDREILELNELSGGVVDGTLTHVQRLKLSRWLLESEAARRYYVRALGQSASLHDYAAEIHAEAPDRAAAGHPSRVVWWTFGALAAAAAVTLGFLLPGWINRGQEVNANRPYVAQLTAAKETRWKPRSSSPLPGALLREGEKLDLEAGFAEITFDSGARVVLEGAAQLELHSAWDATLRHGTLKASVPPEALGFRISNPVVEVIDLGTEFTLIAARTGEADVLVLKGEVEAAPRTGTNQEVILLRENESRRFAPGGVSVVSDSAEKFARFAAPLDLERFTRGLNSIHWAFDEAGGEFVRGEPRGIAAGNFDAEFHVQSAAEIAGLRTVGWRGNALRFNGSVFAQASVPGISGDQPRTVAFWIRVPKDAPLSDAYSMVAWIPDAPKLGHRPIGINWNRDPSEGPVGALRTDFAGGCAMGMTSLRDGEWHHIAVCFAAGESGKPVQVKQYVDGRLESSGVIPGRIRGPASPQQPELQDFIWIGCRLKTNGPQQQRFKGEMDELYITDRWLEPTEIVHLMAHNELPATAMAANVQ